jgi:hypothetical protein
MITFDHDGSRFNYRVAGVAIQDHGVLLPLYLSIPRDWQTPGRLRGVAQSSSA